MRLGCFGARGDRRGLATMTTEFCRHMKPDKVLGIEVPGPRHEWSAYEPETLQTFALRHLTDGIVRTFLDGLDVVYLAETDYDPNRPGRLRFNDIAEKVGCKVVLHAMPEMCRFAKGAPNKRSERAPDLIVLPTDWMADRFPGAVVLPFPVNRDLLPPVRRTEAKRFLHPVGKPAMLDRAGTKIVRESGFDVHIASQKLSDRPHYHDIYADYDVLVAPRRFGGQSLPLMEAASSAMPIIALDRSPESQWLPPEARIPVKRVTKHRMMGGYVEVSDADPKALAEKLAELAASPSLVAELSEASDNLAAGWSWEVLGPQWRELLESVCA